MEPASAARAGIRSRRAPSPPCARRRAGVRGRRRHGAHDDGRRAALRRRQVLAPRGGVAAVAGARKPFAQTCRRRLGGDDRRFHNLQHIDDCLHRFDEVAPLLDDRDAVEMALWCHDAVYVPARSRERAG